MRRWLVVLLVLAAVPAAADTGWVTVDRITAVVNRDIVLDSEVTQRLDAGYRAELDAIADPAERARKRAELRSALIREIVDTLLVEQHAARAGVTVEDTDIDAAITEIKTANNLDDAGLVAALKNVGYTMDKYREELRRQLMRLKAVNLFARARINITDTDLRKAYDEAKLRDPKGTGTYADMKAALSTELYQRAVEIEMTKVLGEWHAAAYIDVRSP